MNRTLVPFVIAVICAGAAGYALGARGADDGRESQGSALVGSTLGAPSEAMVARCIDLWNAPPNASRREVLAGWRSTRNVYVHVGSLPDFPQECEITAGVTGPGDIALLFQQTGGVSQPGATFDPAEGLRRNRSGLPSAQKVWNAKLRPDGTLRVTGS